MPLVNSPQAVQFLESTQMESGLNVLLGEEESVDPMVAPEYLKSRILLRQESKKVMALASDPTRTDVQRHIVAKKVADTLVDTLTKSKTAFEKRANDLDSDWKREVDLRFAPETNRAALHSEIRDWMWETAKKAEGLADIKQALAESRDAAAVLWHSPNFLLPKNLHLDELRVEVLKKWEPEVFAKFAGVTLLQKVARKFDETIRKVRVSFYHEEIAKQASKRVEV